MAERIDDLQCNGYRIIQDSDGFCFGLDAVLLADFAVSGMKDSFRVLDLGTGTGIIPLLIAAKTNIQDIMALEIQEDVADMSVRSVELNHAEDRIHIVKGDIRNIRSMGIASAMNAVTANPPYMRVGLRNENNRKLVSRHEVLLCFRDVAEAASYTLKSGGKFFLVHRPNRLPEIISELMRVGLEPKRMRMVYPEEGKRANLFLMESVKGGGRQMIVEPPLIVYSSPGVFSREICRIHGKKYPAE